MTGIGLCPVCGLKVFPREDGACPSCRRYNFATRQALENAAALSSAPGRPPGMSDIAGLTRTLGLGLTATAALSVLSIVAGPLAHFTHWPAPGSASATVAGGLTVALMVTSACTVIAFLAWFYRAHDNLRRGGITDPRFGSAWTVGGFVVPFLSFIRPATVMAEVWRGSMHLAHPDPGQPWKKRRVSPLVPVAWILFLAALVTLGYLTDETRRPANGLWLTLGFLTSTLGTAVTTLKLVRQVASLQESARRASPGARASAGVATPMSSTSR